MKVLTVCENFPSKTDQFASVSLLGIVEGGRQHGSESACCNSNREMLWIEVLVGIAYCYRPVQSCLQGLRKKNKREELVVVG